LFLRAAPRGDGGGKFGQFSNADKRIVDSVGTTDHTNDTNLENSASFIRVIRVIRGSTCARLAPHWFRWARGIARPVQTEFTGQNSASVAAPAVLAADRLDPSGAAFDNLAPAIQ
jgi:hypothetical protein